MYVRIHLMFISLLNNNHNYNYMFLKNILKEIANADVSIPEESSQLEVYITKKCS